MKSRAFLLTLLFMGALALAACGKKGEPDAPDKNQSSYPRTYPSR
jgi:predicted small lipoprotein YifL